MAKAKRDTQRPRKKKGDRSARPPAPRAALDVVPLGAADAATEPCAFCGRTLPLRHVLTIRAGPGADEDVLGALAVCDEHAASAAAFLARALALIFGGTAKATPHGG